MKNITPFFMVGILLTLFSCNSDEVSEFNEAESIFKVHGEIIENNAQQRLSADDPCTTVDLMAGQTYYAGTVSIDNDGTNLILTYTMDPDWTISLTHMSIGDCDDQWVPLTGSENPKVGQFEHTEPHAQGTNYVTYLIPLSALPTGVYCFAAHAEVSGPSGNETAWAAGLDFGGNSWAMYVQATMDDCIISGGDIELE